MSLSAVQIYDFHVFVASDNMLAQQAIAIGHHIIDLLESTHMLSNC